MAEYIEREAAVKAAQDGADEWDGGYNRNRDTYIEAAIDTIPAADVVEVVRCKDCKYREKSDYSNRYYCAYTDRDEIVTANDYCSRGERKEGEG